MLLLDKDEHIVGILAGKPIDDPAWDTETVPGIEAALKQASADLHFKDSTSLPIPPGSRGRNRRGDYKTAAVGSSYGGGQRVSIIHHSLTQL